MMRAVEMYTFMIVTLMPTTLGLPHTCLHYCKLSPEYSSISRPECDCSLHYQRKTRSTPSSLHIATASELTNSGIYYEPGKLKSSQLPSFDEQTLHMLNLMSNLNYKQDTANNTKNNKHRKTYNTSESFTVQDNSNEHDSKSSHKYKRRDNYFQKLDEETKEFQLHLYMDLNSDKNTNRSQLEELKNIFENFQAAEKDSPECINVHIYIFSKYIDTSNKTNTNWGHKVEHDNLSGSQELTEIQNECDQTASIIKQSFYEIKQNLPKKEDTSELVKDEQETNHSLDSNNDIVAQNQSFISLNNKNTTTSSHLYTTLTIYPIDEVYSVTSETDFADKMNDIQSDKRYTGQDVQNSFSNNDLIDTNSAFTSNSPIYTFQTLPNPKEYNKSNVVSTTEPTAKLSEYEDIRTTSNMKRILYNEEDIQIPRIITKELSNGTVLSVVDGKEEISYSDFITNSIISTTSDESLISNDRGSLHESMSNPDLLNTNIDNIVQSDLVEIHGNLYFLFGSKQIPARLIRQPDGEIDVAIDVFSLCDKTLEENISRFLNLLCNCIQLQNCSYLT